MSSTSRTPEDESTVDRVLVAHASKHGATAEIAEAIAVRLAERGLAADCVAADAVEGPLTPYAAVVLGSAVHMKRWRSEARDTPEASLDRRDWAAIDAWADTIAAALGAAPTTSDAR